MNKTEVQSKYQQLLGHFVKSSFIKALLQTNVSICVQTAALSLLLSLGNSEVRSESSLFNSPPYYPKTSISLLCSVQNTQLVSLHYLRWKGKIYGIMSVFIVNTDDFNVSVSH